MASVNIAEMNKGIRTSAKVVIQILNSREYEIIYLYYFYGYLEREIAGMLNLHQSTINRIKRNALDKLREILKN
ncbi:MAG: sigma factor-like helix-turn-helix DNA-binding protein [Candidatus Paceibacterota bacterium]